MGLWEIDLIVDGKGKSKAVLLTLTERYSRKQIIRKIKNKRFFWVFYDERGS